MLELVLRVEFGIVGLFIGEHFENDLEQSLAQTAQSAGVAHTALAFGLIVGLSPDGGFAKAIGPEVDGMAQKFITSPAGLGFADLPGLVLDRCGAGKALEHIVITVTLGIAPNGGQQPRRQDLFGTGQAAKEVMIGMFLK